MKRSEIILKVAQWCPAPFKILLTLSRSGIISGRVDDHWLAKLIAPAVGLSSNPPHWVRVPMYRECLGRLQAMNPASLSALEISAGQNTVWKTAGFRSYTTVDYPAFDICSDCLDTRFDMIIADQVFEHLLWPFRAAKNVHAMLNPGGYFLITTPFLVRLHVDSKTPHDCSRWSETGIRYFLAEAGFPIERTVTGSWGNRTCITENFERWAPYTEWRSLENEPDFPVTVWALAKKG